jgi:hypothetical protein
MPIKAVFDDLKVVETGILLPEQVITGCSPGKFTMFIDVLLVNISENIKLN